MVPKAEEQSVVWVPEAEEDDSGLVCQRSFGVPKGCEVDQYGHLYTSSSARGFTTIGSSILAPTLDGGREVIMLEDVQSRRHRPVGERQKVLNRWVYVWNATAADRWCHRLRLNRGVARSCRRKRRPICHAAATRVPEMEKLMALPEDPGRALPLDAQLRAAAESAADVLVLLPPLARLA